MAGRTRTRGFVSWCRAHPKTAGVGGAVLALFLVAGIFGNDPKKKPAADQLAAGPSATRTTTATSSMAPTTTASSSSSSATAAPARVSAAPADQSQRSAHLAVDVLAAVAVKGRADRTGYARSQFGQAWSDGNDDPLGRNGCDTRNDVLRRDLTSVVLKPGSSGCAVLSGTLLSPYTSAPVSFRRGPSTSSTVQIDHVVSLSDAWQTGAQRYDEATRVNIANDPLNLLAVDRSSNEAKSDGDAATWLPPNRVYRCAYVARQVAVKARYRLWMTQAEHDAVERVLASCPGQTVPTEPTAAVVHLRPKPTPRRIMQPRPVVSAPPQGSDVYYANCAAVEAAGKAPLYAGQPGYAAHLDRDHDGVACET